MKIMEKLGRAGNKNNRIKKAQEWNQKYGENNWEVVYQYNDKIYTRDQALEEFYNKSYYTFLQQNPRYTNILCNNAKTIYNPHAVNTGGVDLQCPAVLDSLKRLNKMLSGTQDIAIGTWGTKFGKTYPEISKILSPFNIPLWCNKNISIENFWQNYKFLAIKD